jgi:hypothetical protein
MPPPEEEAAPAPEQGNSRIEVFIDSLTNHTLSEPIPVSVEPLGDKVFTASADDLGIHGTGNSLGEALLVLKEQIEEVYSELYKRKQLDTEQKAKLQILQTFIAPVPAPKSGSR